MTTDSAADPVKISVLLPVYNGERYLREAVESVLAQTEPGFELLVGDDQSKDLSHKILAEFSDSRMKVFLFDQNAGLFGNLNRLLRQARGALIHFLCQDDILVPSCLTHDIAFFEAHPDVVMSICQATVIDEQGSVLGQWKTGGDPILYDPIAAHQLLLYYGCVAGNLSTVCVRRACIDSEGGFDESFRLAGDYDMWVRLCSRGSLADVQKPLVRMREHGDRLSSSRGAGATFVRETRLIRRNLLPLLPERRRSYARRYVYLRQNVLDTHHFMTCLRFGNLREAWELFDIMGADLLAGLPLWLLTVNNHLYRPKPVFIRS